MSLSVAVKIAGKEYQVACPTEEKPALIAAADMLNENMEQIRATGKVVGLDRIAVMAALNLANDLIKLQNAEDHSLAGVDTKLAQLSDKIHLFLDETRQLDL